MGRTLPLAVQQLLQEQAAYASHALPFEMFLLSTLLEEHKEVMLLRKIIEG